MNINRVIWVILDSVGMGEMPDANKFGDRGSNTLGNIAKQFPTINLENLCKLGLGNIEGMIGYDKVANPIGCFARAAEISNGKDTTVGHWEMVGIHSKSPFPTYPHGFPKDVVEAFVKETGIPGILGNCTASGTEIIKELGEEHRKTKKPIVYTSADSVFQIACHEEIYSVEALYQLCRSARELLVGKHAVARVIARPFIGEPGNFTRTSNRRDFSLKPTSAHLLTKLNEKGISVIAVGKIEDIFAGDGITKAVHTKNNMDGVDQTLNLMKETEKGLIFTNLVEFDSKWGHRNDVEGYKKGLEAFDERLPEILEQMNEDDILVINADHGCDPTTPSTDHSREYVPLLVYGKPLKENVDLNTLDTFADIGATIGDVFGITDLDIGKSFLRKILK